jgi:hypothetical protein
VRDEKDRKAAAEPPSLADAPPAVMSRRGARRAVLAGALLGAALAAAGQAWYLVGDP